MHIINESSAITATLEFSDSSGALTIPGTLRYRIDCDTTGTALVAWSTLSPASSVDVAIVSATNDIQTDANAYEIKAMTVEADYAAATKFTQVYKWRVKNLGYIT